VFDPFSALSEQNQPKSGRSTFYLARFELCGRTIGQMASFTLSPRMRKEGLAGCQSPK
jgi:hypothetical protein